MAAVLLLTAGGDGSTVLAQSGDYDRDDDGLIEVRTLAQLDAIRYDLNGNGAVDDTSVQASVNAYAAAFPNARADLGCARDTDNDPATPAVTGCIGYELADSLDFDTAGNDDVADAPYASWTPIGGEYAGVFEGNDHTISNLTISAELLLAGLFREVAASGAIRNVGLVEPSVTLLHSQVSDSNTDRRLAGALVGQNRGTVSDSYVQGGSVRVNNTTGQARRYRAGGLLGHNYGDVNRSYATCNVSGSNTGAGGGGSAEIGGLIGYHQTGVIRDSYATGTVTATGNARGFLGGLVGEQRNGTTITGSYATGNVTNGVNRAGTSDASSHRVGGLVGYGFAGTIVGSHATGDVVSNVDGSRAGGLVGRQAVYFTGGANPIRNAVRANYATGSVTANGSNSYAGGLVGRLCTTHSGLVQKSYAIGAVSATGNNSSAGGLVGGVHNGFCAPTVSTGQVANSYWDTETTGQSASAGGTGKTTAELQSPTGYTDIYESWVVDAALDGQLNGLLSTTRWWHFGAANQYPMLEHLMPSADAGADFTAFSGQTVTLAGSGQVRFISGAPTYTWAQVGGSPRVDLSQDTSTPQATFTAPEELEEAITLEFELTFTAPSGSTARDRVKVTIGPAQPNQLTNLTVTAGGGIRPLTPKFVASETGPYSASVGAYTTTARVAVAATEGATISFDNRPVKLDDDFAGSVIVHLAEGSNRSTIVVTPPEPDPEAEPSPTPAEGEEAEEPLEPTTYFLNIRRQPVPRLKFEPSRLLMDEGATATYTVDLDTKWLGSEVTVVITSGDPDVTVAPDTVSFRPTDWAPREVTVTVAQDDDGENEVVTLDHAASGGHFDRVYGRLRVEITDDDAGRVTPTPSPTPEPTGTPAPTPTPTPPPALPTTPSDSEQTLTLDGRSVTITRQAGSLSGVSVALPSVLTRDLQVTIAPLLAGIPLESERFGLGMTAAAQSGATLTVVGVPAGGLEICLPVAQSLVSEAGARSLTLVRYGGAGWESLPGAARRGMSVCASGVSTGVFAAAYIIPPPPMLGLPSDLTVSIGDTPGTLILRWTPGQDATSHWIAGIKQSDLTAGDTSNIIWTAASSSNTHTLTGLASGAEYAFAVAAGRGSQWSSWTALARGTPD